MKRYSFFLMIFFLHRSTLLASAQNSRPLIPPPFFSWSCHKKETASGRQLIPDKKFAHISKLKEIVQAAVQKRNQTIITISSDNQPSLKLLRVQLTDVQDGTTFLITYRVQFLPDHQLYDTQDKPIWSFVYPNDDNNITTTIFTANELLETIVDAHPLIKKRLTDILCCRSCDRINFYPQYLEINIPEFILTLSAEEKQTFLQQLDPRTSIVPSVDNKDLRRVTEK
jgi:hypothetical protein